MAIEELLEQMDAALDDGDVATARELLGEVRAEFRTRNAWHWLRTNQPKSYEQLIEELEQALNRAYLRAPGQTELRQLADVFRWCEEHGIELTDLDVPAHIHKYREAVSLDLIRRTQGSEEMREALGVIRGHSSRKKTRVWKVQERTRLRQEMNTQD